MKTIKKAQNGNNVKPDYRNIKKEKRTIKGSKEIVPTAKDSADYREGFENAVKKVRNTRIPKSSNYTRGQREAKERNLKSGGAIKKAQNGATKPYIKYSDPKPLLDSLANVRKKLDAEKASLNSKQLNEQRTYNKAKKELSKKTTPKAKDGKWIQKATASIKRRGTEGKCTPITKPGCTGKAKALAKTFKKMAKARKK